MTERKLHTNDRMRGIAASWHLHRAVAVLGAVLSPTSSTADKRRGLKIAGEHLRIARGYLGAVGFENGWRLYSGVPR